MSPFFERGIRGGTEENGELHHYKGEERDLIDFHESKANVYDPFFIVTSICLIL